MPILQRSVRRTFILSLIGVCVSAGCSKTSSWVRRGDADQGVDGSNQSVRGIARLTDSDTSTPTSVMGGDKSSDVQFASMTKPVIGHTLRTLTPGDNFDAMIQEASGVVLVDFFAEWCGPCKKQSVILHALEPEAADYGAVILKVNVDEHKDIARRFSVSSLPTLIIFKDGEVIERQTGLTDRRSVERLLKM